MEKVTLKPAVKEFLYRSGEENVYFDVLSYQGSTAQEKSLGALFAISQIKYFEEDLSYLVSLILSLAKREYYSETSFQEQNPKETFSRTLKKLNEVLEDFFQNKNFKLNIGLVAIVGENIFISRLGKFKINLARNNQLVDILNNVELFRKDAEGEKQFSNIISGKLQPNDRLFAFFPTRTVTSREKQLNDIFVKENQDGFGQKIAHLAANVSNFSCCGVHIGIQQIKEIPFQSVPKFSIPISASSADAPVRRASSRGRPGAMSDRSEPESPAKVAVIQPMGAKAKEVNEEEDKELPLEPGEAKAELRDLPPAERPRIIPAEFSVTKRGNIFTAIAARLVKLQLLNRFNNRTKPRIFITLAAVVIAIPVFLIFFRGDNQTDNTIGLANENLKLAQSRLSQNNVKEARSLLQAALLNISDLSSKKADSVRGEINQVLANLDRVSEKQPVIDETADVSKIFASIIPKALAGVASDKNSALYEDNLYVLSETGTTIYKYADAAKGKTVQTVWGSLESRAIAIAVDGDIYALNEGGKLTKYFKGKKLGEFDLQIAPPADSRIFTAKDSAFIYLADKTNRRVFVFDKANGELKISYNLTAVGKIQEVSVSANGTIWILSADNKVWSLK
jgi:hypothetical protein